jgi:hypothetical protein
MGMSISEFLMVLDVSYGFVCKLSHWKQEDTAEIIVDILFLYLLKRKCDVFVKMISNCSQMCGPGLYCAV